MNTKQSIACITLSFLAKLSVVIWSRRTFIKALSATPFVGATPSLFASAPHETGKTTESVVPITPLQLPDLPYAYNALEPFIDARTMEIHHTKHHAAFIRAANEALAPYPELAKQPPEALLANLATLPEEIRETVNNNIGGHLNHALFWKILSPSPQPEPSGRLIEGIEELGSIDALIQEFEARSVEVFGSGWTWLCVIPGKGLSIVNTPNQNSPLLFGYLPILGLDLWEHSFYLNYENRRMDYVKAFWKIVCWKAVSEQYEAALATIQVG